MNGRKFRRFWLLALGKPALITLLLSAPCIVWVLVDFPHSTKIAVLAVVPLAWFYSRYLAWRTTRWTFDVQAKALVIRGGMVNRDEKRIPLNFPPQVSYSQSWVGRLFNFGTAELSSFGRPVKFHQVGDFRAFKDALTSPGKALPEARPPILAMVIVVCFVGLFKLGQVAAIGLVWLARASAPLLARLLRWFLNQTRSGVSAVAAELTWLVRASAPLPARLRKQVQPAVSVAAERATSPPSIQRSNVNPDRVSYDGFLAHCSDFVLSNGHQTLSLDYTQPDSRRSYYPHGISPDVADIYFTILRQTARIVTLGTNGYHGWILRPQIKDIDDIRLRISREAFYSQVIEWNNVGHSEKQTLAFREAHRRRESRPVA